MKIAGEDLSTRTGLQCKGPVEGEARHFEDHLEASVGGAE